MVLARCFLKYFIPLLLCLGPFLADSAWSQSGQPEDAVSPSGIDYQQETEPFSLDLWINEKIRPVSQAVSNIVFYSIKWQDADGQTQEFPLIVGILMGTGIFLTIFLRGVNFWGLSRGIKIALGRQNEPGAPGQITHFQAFTAALSGTVGLGNIAGVAAAISIGGPGALVWMIVAAFFGMATKFVECSLGVKYRHLHSDGDVSGGGMYYLSRGLAERGWSRTGKFLAVFFAFCCVGGALGGGNMFQSNQAYQSFVVVTGGETGSLYGYGWAFGLFMAFICGLVIIGGIKSIANVTEKIVPIMGIFYLISGVIVILFNIHALPAAIVTIITSAFAPEAGYGGVIGVMIWGIQRATFSNEAGVGTTPIVYAAIKTRQPLSAGFIALLEPLIDTIIICSVTALVIVISGAYTDSTGLQGVELTSKAFATVIGWFPYVLAIAIFLFAFSTLITFSYYGLKSWTYIFGKSQYSEITFKILFLLSTVLGAAAQLDEVITFSDSMIFAMIFPNLIGVFLLSGGVRRDLWAYLQQEKAETSAQR